MKLYDISGQFEKLDTMMIEIDNEADASAYSELYAELIGSFADKADGICRIIKNCEGEIEAIDAELKRLADRKKSRANKIESLKNYLEFEMIASGQALIKSDLFSLSIQNNPPRVVIDNEALLTPDCYIAKVEISKSQIKELLSQGPVPGAHLEQTKGLRIR